MRRKFVSLATLVVAASSIFGGEEYKLGPDSQANDGVPKGTVTEYKFTESAIYAGTSRSYWIYLPPNFKADVAYPYMVFFDGGGAVGLNGGFRVPVVFDNLIAKGEIPAMAGLFINPGGVPAVAKGTSGRSTRSYEYDTPDELCARFVIEEMVPLLAKHAKLSANPDDHGVWGISSGGIAAFNLAWQRPDHFRKVISYIGSFTNIRGAYWFPSAIRKTERRPIRVFLQEGSHDLDNVHGNWPFGNQEMAAALKFAGYDYKFTMGDGSHSGQQGGSILPDALRWLWRKPEPLPAPAPDVPNDMALSGILIPGEDWKLVAERKAAVWSACSDADGNYYFCEAGSGIFKIALDGSIAPFNAEAKECSSMAFGPDGRFYACLFTKRQLAAFDKNGKADVLASDVAAQNLVVTHGGSVFFTDLGKEKIKVWEGPGKIRELISQFNANGMTLSPNQETLAVSDCVSPAIWSMRVETDGKLGARMPVMPYSRFGSQLVPEGGAMICDTRRRFYCATTSLRIALGIETYDPDGRPIGLILPPCREPITSITLSGKELGYLFASTEKGKIYARKVNAKGFVTSAPPILGDEKKK